MIMVESKYNKDEIAPVILVNSRTKKSPSNGVDK